tara:strand:+ start:937 stop:1206 length:270 start_codon:yes stop_codon:yes gene_type:complete
VKEIESIIEEVTNKNNAQALERLRVKTIDAQAEALADGYLSGIHDVILMLQDYMKDGLKDKLKEQALKARETQTKSSVQRSNNNTGKSK